MGRAPCCDKTSVKKGPWSPEEDAKLKSYIDQHGTGGNWIALPQKIGLKRCGKSCRLRWLNYLRPNIRHGGFSEEEDRIICSLYVNIGSRWSIIAAQLPGRTDNDIKNYWNTRLKKKLFGKQRKERGGGHQSMSGRRGKRSLSSSSVLLNHHNISIINSPMVPNNNPINSSPNNQNLGQLSMPYWTPLITTHEATARATTSSSNILLNCSSSSNFNPLGFPDEPNFHSKRSLLLTPTKIEGDHHDSVTLDYGNYLHRHHYHDEGRLMNLPFLTDQQIIINDHFSSSGPLTNMMMTANNYNTTLEKLGQDTLYCTAGNSSNIINPPPVIATTMTTTTAADNNNNSFPLELEGLMSTNVVHPDHHLRERSLDEDGLDNLLPWNELIKYSCSDVVRTAGSCSDTSYGSDDDQSFNESSTWDEMGSLISLLIPPPAQVSADGFDESREVHRQERIK